MDRDFYNQQADLVADVRVIRESVKHLAAAVEGQREEIKNLAAFVAWVKGLGSVSLVTSGVLLLLKVIKI